MNLIYNNKVKHTTTMANTLRRAKDGCGNEVNFMRKPVYNYSIELEPPLVYSIELDKKLPQSKLLAKKVKNFRETGYMESNEERSSREAEETYIDYLIDEMSINFEQTGIFETTEERYQREVLDNWDWGHELPNNTEKPFVKYDKFSRHKEKFKQKQFFEEE